MPFMSAIDAIRGQEIKVLKVFFIFTLLSPTIILQGAEVDRQALGSRQLYLLLRSLPHDPRNLPHLHIQVETDRVLNLLLMETTFLCSVIPSTTSWPLTWSSRLSPFSTSSERRSHFSLLLWWTPSSSLSGLLPHPLQINHVLMQLYIICFHSVKRIKDFLNAEELEEFSSSDEKVRST